MLRSAIRGSWRSGPRPPALRGWVDQAKCEYRESVDMPVNTARLERNHSKAGKEKDKPRTVVLRLLNWGIASLNARISVGHTKVKSLVKSFNQLH
jgi:hypothetical protein